MGAVVVVEVLPLGQLLLEIHVVSIRKQLIELVLVGSVGALDLSVQLRSSRFDVDVFHTQVRDVPVEERLELVATVGSDGANPEGELVNDIVDEVDRVGLGVAAIHLQRSDSRRIVDGGVLIPPHRAALFPLQGQKLDVYLYVVPGDPLLVAVRVHGTPTHSIGESVEPMPLTDPIYRRVGCPDVVVALQVPSRYRFLHR